MMTPLEIRASINVCGYLIRTSCFSTHPKSLIYSIAVFCFLLNFISPLPMNKSPPMARRKTRLTDCAATAKLYAHSSILWRRNCYAPKWSKINNPNTAIKITHENFGQLNSSLSLSLCFFILHHPESCGRTLEIAFQALLQRMSHISFL